MNLCYNKIKKTKHRKKNKMNKIHNNLTIENLIKTDSFKKLTVKEKESLLQNSQWFNQFQELQQQEILKGLKANLDVSIYAKKEFDYLQMQEILTGLFTKVDVSIYANPDLDYNQMREIRNETYKDYYDEYVRKIMEEKRKRAKNNEQNI